MFVEVGKVDGVVTGRQALSPTWAWVRACPSQFVWPWGQRSAREEWASLDDTPAALSPAKTVLGCTPQFFRGPCGVDSSCTWNLISHLLWAFCPLVSLASLPRLGFLGSPSRNFCTHDLGSDSASGGARMRTQRLDSSPGRWGFRPCPTGRRELELVGVRSGPARLLWGRKPEHGSLLSPPPVLWAHCLIKVYLDLLWWWIRKQQSHFHAKKRF